MDEKSPRLFLPAQFWPGFGRPTVTQRRPVYSTPDGQTVPDVKTFESNDGRHTIGISAYAKARDALSDMYGHVKVTHDTVRPELFAWGGECWPQCRGARSWGEDCDCPCMGTTHGEYGWLLNYVLLDETLIPSCPMEGYEVMRRTYLYVHGAKPTGPAWTETPQVLRGYMQSQR